MESKKLESMMHEKLQLLRSITNSPSVNGSSIVVDASNYIRELKQKIQKLNQEMGHHHHHHHLLVSPLDVDNGDDDQPSSSTPHHQHNGNPVVTVETLEKGFLINVVSLKNCPGLLVSVLEAFEEIGLNVVEARVSCTDSFRLQAVGGGGQILVSVPDLSMASLVLLGLMDDSLEFNYFTAASIDVVSVERVIE